MSIRRTPFVLAAAAAAAWFGLVSGAGAAAVPEPAAAAAAGPGSAPAPPAEAAAPISEAAWWRERVQTLTHDIARGQSVREDADTLYPQLSEVLEKRSEQLEEALHWARSPNDRLESLLDSRIFLQAKGESPPEAETPEPRTVAFAPIVTVADLHAEVKELYDARITLLASVTPQLRAKVTGTFLDGVRELGVELRHIALQFRFSRVKLNDVARQLLERAKQVPLHVLGRVIQLVVVIALFRWWRRWAREGLPRLRARVLEIRPRRRELVKLARSLWYLDRVRAPLEWLVIFVAVFAILDIRGFGIKIFHVTGQILTSWVLLSWFAVSLINAVADRGVSGIGRDTSGLRLRSLRLIAVWLVLLGLGLDLAETYAGKGTLYEWVWMAFWVLMVPVALLLLTWWRPEVKRRLSEEVRNPAWIERMLNEGGEKGTYKLAAMGGAYLSALAVERRLLQGLTEVESGRRFLAQFLRREAQRQQEREGFVEGRPISPELRSRLLKSTGSVFETFARPQFNALMRLAERGLGGAAMVVADRGGGKSVFLRRLVSKFGEGSMLVNCPIEGYAALESRFREAVGLEGESSTEALPQRLADMGTKLICIDNLHRLCRPELGGQAQLESLSKFFRRSPSGILWVLGVDRVAWRYISRVHARTSLLEEVVELPTWSEEQLGELLKLRCADAGITPQYGRYIPSRYLDEAGQRSVEEMRRASLMRILWSAADGNPGATLRLWVDSLSVNDDGEIVANLPQEPDTSQLDQLNPTALLVLRVIAQIEFATGEEIARSLRLSTQDIDQMLRIMLLRGWIDQADGRYRITGRWFRVITRTLTRRNLLAR